MKIPPPLVWTEEFKESTVRGMGVEMRLQMSKTVNPLVYSIIMEFPEPLSSSEYQGLWNMFQIWASKNDCVPYGKVRREGSSVVAEVIIKRRNGPDRKEFP